MSRSFLRSIVLATLVAGLPGAVLAQSNSVALVVAGEAYDGAPKFEVSFDGEVLGEGVVDTAIDTATVGRFADAAVKQAHSQRFDFSIPDEMFRPDGEVRVRFINEAYGGPDTSRDRNIYLLSIGVNGAEVPATALRTESAAGLQPNAILGDYLVLFDGTTEAVALPEGGWPGNGTESAEAPAPETAPVSEPAADVTEAEVVPPVEVAVPVVAPVATEVAAAPVPPVPAPAPAAVTPAAVSAEAESCDLDQIYNVIGFNENSNDLTPRLMERLDQILGDIGTRECEVQVVGYSSTLGNHATNALFAVERAQNVLRYLREQGLRVAGSTATGAGATEQFGPEPGQNRRVVITVKP